MQPTSSFFTSRPMIPTRHSASWAWTGSSARCPEAPFGVADADRNTRITISRSSSSSRRKEAPTFFSRKERASSRRLLPTIVYGKPPFAFRMHRDHEQPPHPPFGHPLPLGGGEGGVRG